MRLLVTVGTDGLTNWVKLPDGRKLSLGTISVLNFMVKLALGGSKEIRSALDRFLQGKEVKVRVDDDKMWKLLTPRVRWAANSFISYAHRGNDMTISRDLELMERHVATLHRVAGKAPEAKMREGFCLLGRLAQKMEDQSDNAKYYNLGDPEVFEAKDREPDVVTVDEVDESGTRKLAASQCELISSILDKMESVNNRIDELTKVGKKFNSNKARFDIHEVTRKVASMVASTDSDWIEEDLNKLAARADQLYRLFFPGE